MSESQVALALRRNFLFAALTDEEVVALAKEVWLERAPANTVIVRELEDADALYLVVEGGVNVTKKDGRFLAYLGRDGFFGEMAIFIEGARRTATCETAVETTFAVIRKDVFEKHCLESPQAALKIYRAIIRTMAERLQATSADLAALMATQVRSQQDVSSIVERAKRKKSEG
jgi:CRP/FNR family cyclic AMP-dependent transcriptional regulator